jgi:pyruvate-ferredoxin/flavodoxin oxidoreductase
MVTHKIGGVPVVDDNSRVVGVITETDIFRAFVEMLGGGEHGLRLTVQVPAGSGTLAKLAGKIAEQGGPAKSLPSTRSRRRRPMGEWADQWMAEGKRTSGARCPACVEMQSEGGAAGAVHGALQTGALATTFTASQGLLLMIPNMYKIAGELTPCFHARRGAHDRHARALDLRRPQRRDGRARDRLGAMLCSNSVQEAMDLALVAQAATLEARVPFLHFFDGFRTSHEVAKIEMLNATTMCAPCSTTRAGPAHRATRALAPTAPVLRGTAQNPTCTSRRARRSTRSTRLPDIVQNTMDELRAPRAASTTSSTTSARPARRARDRHHGLGRGDGPRDGRAVLNAAGEKVGVLKVRLYRPFSIEHFVQALPATVKRHRGARPHEGTRRHGRAALPGRDHALPNGAAGRRR